MSIKEPLNLDEIKSSRDVLAAFSALVDYIDNLDIVMKEHYRESIQENRECQEEINRAKKILSNVGENVKNAVISAHDESKLKIRDDIFKIYEELKTHMSEVADETVKMMKSESVDFREEFRKDFLASARETKLEQILSQINKTTPDIQKKLIEAQNSLKTTISDIQNIDTKLWKKINFTYVAIGGVIGMAIGGFSMLVLLTLGSNGAQISKGLKAIKAEGNELLALSQRIDENLAFEKAMRKFGIELIPVMVGKRQEIALKIPEKHLPQRENVFIDRGYGIIPLK